MNLNQTLNYKSEPMIRMRRKKILINTFGRSIVSPSGVLFAFINQRRVFLSDVAYDDVAVKKKGSKRYSEKETVVVRRC